MFIAVAGDGLLREDWDGGRERDKREKLRTKALSCS